MQSKAPVTSCAVAGASQCQARRAVSDGISVRDACCDTPPEQCCRATMPLILTAVAGLLMLSQSPGRSQPARPVVSAQAAQAPARAEVQAQAQAARDSALPRAERTYGETLKQT